MEALAAVGGGLARGERRCALLTLRVPLRWPQVQRPEQEWQARLRGEELEELLKNAEEASEKMSNASGEAWEDAKEEFDEAYKALQEAVENRKEAVTREGRS